MFEELLQAETFTNQTASGVYAIICLANNKVYIGSSVNIARRIRRHLSMLKDKKHHNNKLQNAWHKYGVENFIFKVLWFCSKEDLCTFEQQFIDKFDFEKQLFNINPSAENCLGRIVSNETREKIRVANLGNKSALGKVVSEETRDKIRVGNTGKKRTPEECRRISELHKGNKYSIGRKLSEETKSKISKANTGYSHTPEGKEKIRLASIRRFNEKIGVCSIDKITGEFKVFYNLNDAIADVGKGTKSNIGIALSGKTNSAFGRFWYRAFALD